MFKAVIETLPTTPIEELRSEIVERKGLGHPDSLCDGTAEASSRALSKYYLEEKGFVLHHNLDKGLLVGGVADVRFGGGSVVEPPEITVAGTATILGNKDEVKKVIFDAVVDYLENNLRFFDELNPDIKVKIHPGSKDLVEIYERYQKEKTPPLSNDTSVGVGFAPLTKLESLVLNTEKFLNSKEIKKKYPWVGEDVKVMGIRQNGKITLTIAIAFVSKFIDDPKDYYEKKSQIKESLSKKFGNDIKFFINTGDRGDSVYITVTGLSCENGDDGQVGRGNRVNGLITPFRSMSLEAAAGKNPISHVGKIYNIKANQIANRLANELQLKEVYVQLLSQIGKPITEPYVVVQYVGSANKTDIEHILKEELAWEEFKTIVDGLLSGSIPVF